MNVSVTVGLVPTLMIVSLDDDSVRVFAAS